MKTVLITGASSGIGKASALEFAAQGWNVAATMRQPEKAVDLKNVKNVQLFTLDVTDSESIANAFEQVVAKFGKIDAVVNNAGYGVDGVFEAMSDDIIQRQFDTNVFGLMRVTRKAIEVMRGQKDGAIVQVASMGGRLAFPLFSIYHGTKWAVEGFSESLMYELRPFNIRVKLIEPGAIKTEFYGRSREFITPKNTDVYNDVIAKVVKISQGAGAKGDSPEKVAKAIVRAAEDKSNKLRFPVGSPAPLLLWMRYKMPDTWFFKIVKSSYKI
jgi:NAD(P)-dependent dehydrogenase (short-subunit alcohol dehydrogenase family)